uniref:Toxoplasma gondii family B protein n=1 Tax=Toxoplasma gondii (strain ATCC 50861 / VEG) TaxID=432359 RepID=A0A0F7UVF9_TOXGV|nr:TPA: hypothetical protein BN1205_089200 [Toxoplasma gondii VEG]
MMVPACSAATLAFFISLLCFLSNCCIGSRAMTTEVVAAPSPMTTTTAAPPVVKKKESPAMCVYLLHCRSRSSRTEKKTAAIRRRMAVTVTAAAVLLTAVVRMLLASVKLQQCLDKNAEAAGDKNEGNTERRLAEGGSDEDKCVSLNTTSTGCRGYASLFDQDHDSDLTLHSSRATRGYSVPSTR